MKKEELFNIIGEVDEQKVAAAGMAMNTKKKSRPVWLKWGAMAACLCLVVVGAFTIPNLQNETPHGQGTMEQVYTLPQAETMSVELVEWSVDHFKGIVVDAGDNSIFPADAELSVVFDYDTEILLDDGTVMVFNPDEPDTDAIGWKEGTIVTVKFVSYDEYREGNHFYYHAYASYVEVAEECLELPDIEVEQIDYSPMVMFNDILYRATSYSGDKEDLSVVGKIESYIDYGVPTENNQANDTLVGCEIYITSSAPDFIFVLNNGVYSPYKSTDGAGIE